MPAKLKIMHVVQSLVKGGAERMVLEISDELRRRDLAEVMIVAFDSRNDYPALSSGMNIRVCPVKYDLHLLRKNDIDIASFNAIVKEFRPDVIHTHCYFQEAPPRENPFPGVAYFTHIHDNMPAFALLPLTAFFTRRGLGLRYERRRLMKKYRQVKNHFIAVSQDAFDYVEHTLPGDLRSRLHLVPNAINYKRFYNGKTKIITNGQAIRLINVGHDAPVKNQRFLIDVLKELHDKGFDARIEFVGHIQKIKEQLRQASMKYDLQDSVTFSGLVENVEEHLWQSHIYVHSSLSEAFGLVMIEAMAAGLPVVCLDAKGNRDIIKENKNGFMIRKPDAGEFAGKIIELIKNPQLYAEVSEYATKYAAAFDIGNYTERLLKLYSEAIAECKVKITEDHS